MRILTALLMPVSMLAQAATVDLAAIDTLVESELRSTGTPGAALVIVQGDRVLHMKGYGEANVETGEKVTPHTLFRIGSTTKMFTAAAVLTLVAEGKLDLHKPLSAYRQGLNPAIGALTAHQLLSHTAGLGDRGSGTGSHDDAALGKTIRELPSSILELNPGEIFSYSSLGYWTAGMLLEDISGKAFADAVHERVFQPVGMIGSTFRPLMAMTYPLAQQHEGSAGKKPSIIRPFADQASSWPGGSAFASANGLGRFMIAFLNGGKLEGKRVLPAEVIERMATVQAAFPGAEDTSYTYGLVSSKSRGVWTLSHGGARIGYGSMLIMAPEQKVGVAVIANRSNAMLAGVAQRAVEALVKFTPEESDTESSSEPPSAASIRSYQGTYAGGPIEVTVGASADGKMHVTMNGKTNAVRSLGRNRFVAEGPVGYFVLIPGADGSAKYMFTNLRSLRRKSLSD